MFKKLKEKINNIKYKLLKDDRIAIVKIEGIIIDSPGLPVASRVIELIEKVKDLKIKAMVLRVNSPGGTVGASQEINDAIKRAQKEGIKVVVSLGDVAASGGVYVAVAGDKIVSNPGTITGSIGVIMRTSVIKDLYQKIGVDHQVIKSGAHKDIISNIRYMTDEEKEILQQLIDNTYQQFVEAVASGRNLDIEKVKSFSDGRIFSGIQAKELGLVDEIGSLADAVKLAADLVGIEKKPFIIDLCPKKSLLQKITSASIKEFLESTGFTTTYTNVPLWLMPGIY